MKPNYLTEVQMEEHLIRWGYNILDQEQTTDSTKVIEFAIEEGYAPIEKDGMYEFNLWEKGEHSSQIFYECKIEKDTLVIFKTKDHKGNVVGPWLCCILWDGSPIMLGVKDEKHQLVSSADIHFMKTKAIIAYNQRATCVTV